MVKFTSSLLVAALVAAPVFASANWDELDARDLSERNFYGRRELTETEAIFTRELENLFGRVSEDIATREIEFQDLAERSKIGRFFGHVFGGIKKIASAILRREDGEEVFAREADDLESRELDQLFGRYVEEIEQRTPGFLNFMTRGMESVKHISREFDELSERDLEEEFYQREFDDTDFFERDFEIDDLD